MTVTSVNNDFIPYTLWMQRIYSRFRVTECANAFSHNSQLRGAIWIWTRYQGIGCHPIVGRRDFLLCRKKGNNAGYFILAVPQV